MTSRNSGPGRIPGPDDLDALLDGGAAGAQPLDRLVSAARAPGRTDELTGLDDALDAAAAARVTPISRGRRALIRVGAATAVTKIVALSAVGAAAVSGVVVAGATGHLPGQHSRPARPAPASSGAGSSSGSASQSRPSATPTDTAGVPPGPTTPSASTGGASGTTAAAVPLLCRQWLALPGGSPVRDQPRFTVLVRTAGGRAQVTAYCRRLAVTASVSPSIGITSGRVRPSRSPSTTASGTSSPRNRASPSRRSTEPNDN